MERSRLSSNADKDQLIETLTLELKSERDHNQRLMYLN